jgi:hypothetical protein
VDSQNTRDTAALHGHLFSDKGETTSPRTVSRQDNKTGAHQKKLCSSMLCRRDWTLGPLG